MGYTVDYTLLRKQNIELHQLDKADEVYTFYYDETNNSRKFRITDTDFNVSKDKDFVLGGLVHKGEPRNFDTSELVKELNLQANIKEIKCRHIADGQFIDCLKSKKLNILLKWLTENEIYIHYAVMNNLYFGVVDIIDSIIYNGSDVELNALLIFEMKNVLYKYINIDIATIHDVFLEYKYPNIDSEQVSNFCSEMIKWIDITMAKANFNDCVLLGIIKQLFEEAKDKEELCFLQDNEDLILTKGYESLYIRPICLFKDSTHIFDEESEIVDKMNDITLVVDDATLRNYSFVKSHDNMMIQLSDVIVGVIGKMAEYTNCSSIESISQKIDGLEGVQKENLMLIAKIIASSEECCKAFFCNHASYDEISKFTLIWRFGRDNS